jgi:O-antigen ligase
VPLWNFVWHETAGRRLQGFGWGAFWLTERVQSARDALNWFPRHAHNAYLQIVVNLGLVGLAIVVAVGLLTLRRAAWLVQRTGLAEYSAGRDPGSRLWQRHCESAFAMPRDMAGAAAVAFGLVVVRKVARV